MVPNTFKRCSYKFPYMSPTCSNKFPLSSPEFPISSRRTLNTRQGPVYEQLKWSDKKIRPTGWTQYMWTQRAAVEPGRSRIEKDKQRKIGSFPSQLDVMKHSGRGWPFTLTCKLGGTLIQCSLFTVYRMTLISASSQVNLLYDRMVGK